MFHTSNLQASVVLHDPGCVILDSFWCMDRWHLKHGGMYVFFSFREVVFYGEVNRLTNKRVGESKMKDYQEDKKTEETA